MLLPATGADHGPRPGCAGAGRLDQIPGVGAKTAQVIVPEIGLDMTRFPTPADLVSWARLSPRTVQSGALSPGRQDRQGQPLRLSPVLG